ncbi:DNA polymerase III subunit alpha [Hyphococcus flavus]|uniref:DNA polymerase III subunit alpha n=1 Tax=Hyphococcus flavus TaxID=1866326 RepID=A0AAF0CEG1_9PROT|nr:DNA polymerase III subunit alpha [Hyphococcus flavus]WDI31196.1 DNA polymerase III subunit alpha [Hyphococcus flavus]
MTAPFVHLHLHSAYSLAEGAIPISRLKDLCTEAGMPAVAVTDTNNLFGALEASTTLAGAGIQPITGLQQAFDPADFGLPATSGVRPPAIVLLAQNEAGYKNLLKITSRAFLDSRSEEGACASMEWLEDANSGTICLTGGFDGPVDRLLREGRSAEARMVMEKLARLFPNRLYVELQRHRGRENENAEADLIDLAYDLDLPLVAANEPFFPTPDDYEAHDALLCVADGAYVHQDDRRKVTQDHFFKSTEEMTALFHDLPEAIENTVEVARRCAFRPRFHDPILPSFAESADGDTANAEAMELERQAREGLKERLRHNPLFASESDYWERLKTELDIINSMGFPGYFLIVSDFIKWAKNAGVPVGPGRGSGAGSLVAWSLTITDLDPLRFGLLFERFLNPERVSMPDFDIDFCQDRRDEVIRYVQEKYGRDRVAQIITFGKLQARAVLRDVGRVLNMPFGQVDRICKLVPNNPANPVTLAEALETEPRLKEERNSDEAVSALIEKALKLEGLYRHASTHAAGVVIGDRPLDELVPLYRDPRSDMPATQFNMKWVEPAGLVKFDFLGLKTLTVIDRAVALAGKRGAILDMSKIPLDDKASFEMLGEGAATGVFQLESAGMRSTLRAMKPDTLEDIIALVSLYRPGPMENIPTYIERKQGNQKPDYLHPMLEDVLKETYGVIIYQEQVMQIAQILSGYSLGEADLLRRAMGKKKKEEMDRQRKRFIDGAKDNDVPAAKASSIFDLVQKFAGYGFNKSHAAAYAYIAYQTAWLKANYPAEFLAASMSLDRANTDKLAIFLKEARRTGVEVLPPHVNHSQADFSVEDGAITYALSAIKNVGEGAMSHIALERAQNGPFKDLIDFAERLDLKLIGKRSLENLARAGAFDGLCASRAQAFAAAELLIRTSAAILEERNSDQAGLFALDSAPALAKPKLPIVEDWTPQALLDEERAAVGFYFSGHPLDDYEKELKRLNVTSFTEAVSLAKSGAALIQMAGVVRTVRMRRSKNGNPFAWVELSDQSGDYEITVFAETLNRSRDLLETGAMLLVSVTVEDRDGDARFTCETIRGLDAAAAAAVSKLRISISTADAFDGLKRRLAAVKPASQRESGSVVVVLRLPETGREVDITLPEQAACTPAMRGALKSLEGVTDVELI